MPFEIVRNDIVNMQVDAVVNTANPNPVIGSGVDSGIHKKAGHELLVARQKVLFGRMVITERSKFCLRVTGSLWHWIKGMNASLLHFL